jgi:hypothetical protein
MHFTSRPEKTSEEVPRGANEIFLIIPNHEVYQRGLMSLLAGESSETDNSENEYSGVSG